MKKLLMVNKVLIILAFIGAVTSLLYKNDLTLVVSEILMAICVINTFILSAKA